MWIVEQVYMYEKYQVDEDTKYKKRLKTTETKVDKQSVWAVFIMLFIILAFTTMLIVSTIYQIEAIRTKNQIKITQDLFDKWKNVTLSSDKGLINQQTFTDATGFKTIAELSNTLVSLKNSIIASDGLSVAGIVISTLVILFLGAVLVCSICGGINWTKDIVTYSNWEEIKEEEYTLNVKPLNRTLNYGRQYGY